MNYQGLKTPSPLIVNTGNTKALNYDTSMSKRSKPERIPMLDGFRGYAALWVLLGHVCIFTGAKIPILMVPAFAVDVFMIMSGFLMAQHFFLRQDKEPWKSPKTYVLFYLRRFFRIAPLYYAMLIPAVVWHSYYADSVSSLTKSIITINYDPSEKTMTAINLLAHFSFLFGLSSKYCSNLIIPDWSIGLEMQFYAVFPFLMVLARRFGLVIFSIGSYIVWLLANRMVAVYVTSTPKVLGLFPQPSLLPLKLVYFTSGILLAWAYMENRKLTVRSSAIVILAILQVGVTGNNVVLFITVALAFLLFRDPEMNLGILGSLDAVQSILSNRFASFLGDTSYGVYLVHMLLLIPVLSLVHFTVPLGRFCLVSIVVVPLSYSISWVLSKILETPGIALGKRVTAALRKPKPALVSNECILISHASPSPSRPCNVADL